MTIVVWNKHAWIFYFISLKREQATRVSYNTLTHSRLYCIEIGRKSRPWIKGQILTWFRWGPGAPRWLRRCRDDVCQSSSRLVVSASTWLETHAADSGMTPDDSPTARTRMNDVLALVKQQRNPRAQTEPVSNQIKLIFNTYTNDNKPQLCTMESIKEYRQYKNHERYKIQDRPTCSNEHRVCLSNALYKVP